jgi:hypothetical protein
LNSICIGEVTPETSEQSSNSDKLMIIIFIALLIVLWLDDTRYWHQSGSLLFILATIVTLLSMFYYSTIYPSTSLLSFWLFVEWCILIFSNKQNSKNSLHYSFMKT